MLTVKDLRKALKGIRGSTPVYLRDFDHSTYQTSSIASDAEKLNQKDMSKEDRKYFEEEFIIKGIYFVISS